LRIATPRKRNKEKGKGDQYSKEKMQHTLSRPMASLTVIGNYKKM